MISNILINYSDWLMCSDLKQNGFVGSGVGHDDRGRYTGFGCLVFAVFRSDVYLSFNNVLVLSIYPSCCPTVWVHFCLFLSLLCS